MYSDGRTIAYEYDAEEKITKITDSTDGVTEYEYDALSQLVSETVNGVTTKFVYDSCGNILEKGVVDDAGGNPTSYLGHTLTWQQGRRLKSFDSNTYTYNANGIRTSKTVNGVKHTYTLEGTNIISERWGRTIWTLIGLITFRYIMKTSILYMYTQELILINL